MGPDRFDDLARRPVVLYLKLAVRRRVLAIGVSDPPFDGQVKRMRSLSRVTARFGPTPGAHHGDAKRHQYISESRGFPGAQDDANLRKCNPQGAQNLNEIAVRE